MQAGASIGLGNLTVDQLEAILKSLFPNEAYSLVKDQIAHIQAEPPFALLSIGAVVISLWSASNLFLVLIDALNRTYGVKETRSIVNLRVTAIAMTLTPGGLPARVAGGHRRLAADPPTARA